MPTAADLCLPLAAVSPAIDLQPRAPVKPWLAAPLGREELSRAASDHSRRAASSLDRRVRKGARHRALLLDLLGAGRGAFIARGPGERRYASAPLKALLRLGILRPVRFRRHKMFVSGRSPGPLASQKPLARHGAGFVPRPRLAAQVAARPQ